LCKLDGPNAIREAAGVQAATDIAAGRSAGARGNALQLELVLPQALGPALQK